MSEDYPFSEALKRTEDALCLAKWREGYAQGRANRLRADIKNALALIKAFPSDPAAALKVTEALLGDALALDQQIAEQEQNSIQARHDGQERQRGPGA